jgi:hypothetical protein
MQLEERYCRLLRESINGSKMKTQYIMNLRSPRTIKEDERKEGAATWPSDSFRSVDATRPRHAEPPEPLSNAG